MNKTNLKYKLSLFISIVAVAIPFTQTDSWFCFTITSIIISIMGIGLTYTHLNNITSLLYSTSLALIPSHLLILYTISSGSENIILLYSYLLLTLATSIIYHKKRHVLYYLGIATLFLFIAILYSTTKEQLLPSAILHFFVCLFWGITIIYKLPDSPYNLDDENIDYSLMMENLTEGAMFVSNDHKSLEVNKQWEKITGYSKNELVGKNIREILLYPEDIPFMEEQARERAKGRSNQYNIRIRTKSGQTKWISTVGMPLLNKSGQIIGSLGIMTDKTEDIKKDKQLVAYSKELEFSMAQLKKVNNELEQFAGVVSHDLRSPLNTISNFSSLLEKRYKNDLAKDALESLFFIQQGCDNMRNIINGLLHLAKFGVAQMKKEEIELSEIIHNTTLNLDAVIKENNAIIISSGSLPIYCDKIQIQQLLQNLIENSIKYKKPNIAPKINISSIKEKNGVKILIQDNGIGIKKEYQDQIFIIFNQLNPKTEGIGIGLATCKKIVENHNGTIELDSEEGKGSLFSIYLPQM